MIWMQMAWLLAGIALIVLLTVKWRVHAFFALLPAALLVGLGSGLPILEILNAVKEGFGNILKSLALIIVLGTTLGLLLEHTGSTRVMAGFILRLLGEKRAPLAMSLTGFVVGLPIFCDSGYIVLSGLNNSLSHRTRLPMAVMATSLATGLFSVHCLIPPHPGASAAAGIMQVDFGRLMLFGSLIAIPAAAVGHLWAKYAGRKELLKDVQKEQTKSDSPASSPSVINAFVPVLVPILLITMRSLLTVESISTNNLLYLLELSGEPAVALSVGILLAWITGGRWKKGALPSLLGEAAEKAGGILVIIGAGGAFGAVLTATRPGDHLGSALPLASMGIWLPFVIATVLKTAQGSSTVAIMTAAALVQPLLPSLGLDSDHGRLLCVLSLGAGSMMISHANDAYFWVIAKFSGLEVKTMLRVYSLATVWMGMVSMLMVYCLSKLW